MSFIFSSTTQAHRYQVIVDLQETRKHERYSGKTSWKPRQVNFHYSSNAPTNYEPCEIKAGSVCDTGDTKFMENLPRCNKRIGMERNRREQRV